MTNNPVCVTTDNRNIGGGGGGGGGGEDKMLVTGTFALSHNVSYSMKDKFNVLTHALTHHFEIVPDSKKLQTTSEMGLLRILRYRLHRKHCGKR